jgi:hypothetical protein
MGYRPAFAGALIAGLDRRSRASPRQAPTARCRASTGRPLRPDAAPADRRRFSHLPGFPAQVDLTFSPWGWLGDGRFVLQGGGRTVVAVSRPGLTMMPLQPIVLPAAGGALGGFVALPG